MLYNNSSHSYIIIIPNLSDSKIPENLGKEAVNNKQENIEDISKSTGYFADYPGNHCLANRGH